MFHENVKIILSHSHCSVRYLRYMHGAIPGEPNPKLEWRTMEARPNDLTPLDLARRIVELDAAMHREVHAERYQEAARLRDERVALEKELKKTGNETLIRTVEIAMHNWLRVGPVIQALEGKESPCDEILWRALVSAPLPVRWVVHGFPPQLSATVRKRLDTESLESKYYQATFPVISSTTLTRATHLDEWFRVLANERTRSCVAAIWICTDLFWLSTMGALDPLMGLLQDPSFEFVACIGPDDAVVAQRIIHLPAVHDIRSSLR